MEQVMSRSTSKLQSFQPFTLSLALRSIVRGAGGQAVLDDLNAAMGLSWLVCAVTDEPNPDHWLSYARDAFLPDGTQLFGITVRAIHPPKAAIGLQHADEFLQHFDASYRPLILRALENDQPVLAWRGWNGDARMLWGVITKSCDEGVGFSGDVFGQGDEHGVRRDVLLDRPPLQLYVLEKIEPVTPDPNELFDVAMDHARQILSNGLSDRFNVVTGPGAMDEIISRMQTDGFNPQPIICDAIHTYESALRYFQRVYKPATQSISMKLTELIEHLKRNDVDSFSKSKDILSEVVILIDRPVD